VGFAVVANVESVKYVVAVSDIDAAGAAVVVAAVAADVVVAAVREHCRFPMVSVYSAALAIFPDCRMFVRSEPTCSSARNRYLLPGLGPGRAARYT